MKLDVVQCKTVGIHQDSFLAFIDEDSHALCANRKICRYLAQATGRLGIEDKAYHIYIQLLYIADIFRFGHATYFYDKRSHFLMIYVINTSFSGTEWRNEIF